MLNEENIKVLSVEIKNQSVKLNNKIDNLGKDLMNEFNLIRGENTNEFKLIRSDHAASQATILQAIQQLGIRR